MTSLTSMLYNLYNYDKTNFVLIEEILLEFVFVNAYSHVHTDENQKSIVRTKVYNKTQVGTRRFRFYQSPLLLTYNMSFCHVLIINKYFIQSLKFNTIFSFNGIYLDIHTCYYNKHTRQSLLCQRECCVIFNETIITIIYST